MDEAKRNCSELAQEACMISRKMKHCLMAHFVGIDLGTTNSAVAYRNSYGRPEVIANREGQNITPSVVYFGSDPPVVGQEAKEWARLGNAEIASFFKPHMGNPLFQLEFHGKTYSAADLSTLVLRRLEGRRRGPAGRPGRPRGHHRAGLFRRPPAQGHDRGGPGRRISSAADHQRADGRRAGVRSAKDRRR